MHEVEYLTLANFMVLPLLQVLNIGLSEVPALVISLRVFFSFQPKTILEANFVLQIE